MDLSVYNASMNDFGTVCDLASGYMVGPFVAFDSLTPPVNQHFGINTFRVVYLWLERFGYNAEVEPIMPPWIGISSQWATNIYTVYYGPYLDFGLIGVCACQLMFGCWHGMLYRRATQPQPRAIWVMLFVIFLFPLIMQATTDAYLAAFSNWLNFGLIFLLVFNVLGASRPILNRLGLKPMSGAHTREEQQAEPL
jgi:oligosaccharide repeat unit polymerase